MNRSNLTILYIVCFSFTFGIIGNFLGYSEEKRDHNAQSGPPATTNNGSQKKERSANDHPKAPANSLLPQAESVAKHDKRMAWWRDARFGMFIHWGLYSAAAGEWKGKPIKIISSWTMKEAKTPLKDYMQLRKQFTASKFTADDYVKLAKDAGMKYIILVSKHHEGFCLWDSKSSDYDISSTPYKGDLVKELAESCKRHGMRFGVYYSILDWHHPDYTPRLPWDKRAHKPDFDKYISFMKIQLKELLEIAPNIDILWFDGEWEKSWTHKHGKDLYAYLRSLKPSLLINNRVDKGRQGMEGLTSKGDYAGDFGTPEQQIPPRGLPGVDWETCMTINNTWGYKRMDTSWKSTEVLLHQLIDCASKGGNYLLNIGPTADGTIPAPCPKRLRKIGSWLSRNGEAIYKTSASPFSRRLKWGRCTTGKLRDGVTPLYLHVFKWPTNGKLTVPPLKNKVRGAYLLTDKQQATLQVKRCDGKSTITLGKKPSNDPANVVVLLVEGKPAPIPIKIRPGDEGRLVLRAKDADLHGNTIRYPSGNGEVDSIGYWVNKDDWVSWQLVVPEAKTYRVKITYGCDATGGGKYTLKAGDAVLLSETRSTGGWFKRVTDSIGSLKLPAGETTLTVKLREKQGIAVMDLKRIELVPVPLAVGTSPATKPRAVDVSAREPHSLYVSKLGDNTDGSTWQKAFRTIQAALDAVPDNKGGHKIIVRPDTYVEANLAPSHKGAARSYNTFIGDYDGSLGSGSKGWVVIDSGDPKKGFKSWDWWGSFRSSSKHWSHGNNKETFSSIVWDRWMFRNLYVAGGDAGFFFDLTNKSGEGFTVIVEDCVGTGRAFGGGVVYPTVRKDEPSVFRRCYFLALDWVGDTAAVLVGGTEKAMPKHPHVVFEDCTLVHPDNAVAISYASHCARAKFIRCRMIVLNFTQPEMGGKSTGILCTQGHSPTGRMHIDLEDCILAGYSVLTPGKDSKALSYTTKGKVQAYVQFKQTVPKGFERLGKWPTELFSQMAPPKMPQGRPVLIRESGIKDKMCEMSPVIWKDRLCLMECIRPCLSGKPV